MSTFISNNKDFYKKEFEKVKKIGQEDQIENWKKSYLKIYK